MSSATHQPKSAIRPEYTVESHGKRVVLYAGLLDAAHEQQLRAIHTEIVQVPTQENGQRAIVFARVQLGERTFTGLGDADRSNVSPQLVPHLLRMAETRAKARALRDAVNAGTMLLEDDAPSGPSPRPEPERSPLDPTAEAVHRIRAAGSRLELNGAWRAILAETHDGTLSPEQQRPLRDAYNARLSELRRYR